MTRDTHNIFRLHNFMQLWVSLMLRTLYLLEIHVHLIFRITMGRIRHDLKLEIVRMHRSGTSVAGIRGRLISMGHIKYSSQTEY